MDKAFFQRIRQPLSELAEHVRDRPLRVAVTGLSRSGKTVFITALVQHLLHAQRSQSLPFLRVAQEGRLISVRHLSASHGTPFPFAAALAGLTMSPPIWPDSTKTMSQVRLAVRYRRGQGIKRWLSETSTLTLEIIDYPGEWLLDLPLLQMDYAQWCQQQQALFAQPIHAEYAQAWRQAVALCEADAPADVTQIETLSRQYAEVLQRLQQVPPAMSLLQPGRMLLPGELAQTTRLQFFPLLCPFQLDQVEPDSMLALLNDRFEAYKEQVVLPFYRDHFCHFDRQVVLVDGLKTLNHGEACFKDMQLALQSILQNFQYGHANFIQRLWRPRIDKVLFAMTKADHVTANQHANLAQFLTLIIDDAQRQLQYDGIESRCMALASVRSTVAAQTQLHGQLLSCLKGRLRDSAEEVALFPGEVPTELPSAQDWNSERFQFLDFAPLPLAKTALHAQHHIRLDQALEYLIGDAFV